MGELLGQQFAVENKTGAGGNIGAEAVAKAAPDGYTILMATVSTNAINPGLYKHLPYDAVRDFAPLGRVGVTPTLLLVHPSIAATDVKGLIDLIIETEIKPYDIVAIIPIVTGAGGIVTTWNNGPAQGGGRIIVAGDRRVHQAALEILGS